MDLSSLSDEGLEAERAHMSGILDGFPTTMSMDEEMLASMPMLTGIKIVSGILCVLVSGQSSASITVRKASPGMHASFAIRCLEVTCMLALSACASPAAASCAFMCCVHLQIQGATAMQRDF